MSYVWDWFDQYQEKIYEDDRYGNRHTRMLDYFDMGTDDDADPKYNVACLRKARRLSVELGEELFTLWCDAWLSSELYSVGDYKKSRELLSDAVLRARKPIFTNTPQQLMVHVNLAVNFVFTDPFGYEKEIRQLCDFVKKNSGEYQEHIERVGQLLCVLCIEHRDWKMAERAIDDLQQHISSYSKNKYDWSVSYFRSKVACLNRNWKLMLKHADEGLLDPEINQEAKKSFLFIRACALAAMGDKKSAKPLYRRGNAIRCGIPDADDYMFRSLYWLILEDVEAAIGVRLEEHAAIKNKGRYWEQFKSALHLAELYESLENKREANRWRKTSEKVSLQLNNPQAIAGKRWVDSCFG